LEEVAAVQKDVDELMKQVETFTGKRQDKQYIYLDEMLTRNLLKLDLVETEGKDQVRAARKETIKCIQKAISILESKVMTPEELAARDKAMEVDVEPSEGAEPEPMDVATEATAPPADPAPTSEPAPESTPAPAPEATSEPMSTATPEAPAETPAAQEAPKEPQVSNPSGPEPAASPAPAAPTAPAAQPETTATPPVNSPPAEAAAPAAAS